MGNSMKAFILEGPNSKGKTTALQMLYAVLVINNAQVLDFSPINEGRDFEAVLSYKNKKAAIFSQGDFQYICNEIIAKYLKENVDVLIMAHSSRFLPLTVPEPHTIEVFQKTIADRQLSQVQANTEDCRKLEDIISKANSQKGV
jgi:hypothetical protein